MGIRPCNDPYGGVNPLIDKMIGNAYDIVKYVATYLKEIRYVAENMQSVFLAANGNTIELTVVADSDNLSIALPEDFDIDDLRGLSVIAVTSDGKVYGPDTTTFAAYIDNEAATLNISIASDIPLMASAEYRINLRLKNPV